MSGLGSTMVRAGEMLRRAKQDFGHAHEPRHRLFTALITSAIAMLVLLILGINWDGPAVLDYAEAPLKNARVRNLESSEVRDPDILVIAIDENALAWGDAGGVGSALEGARYAWPWPRHVYNKIIRYCREGGARVIIFDQIFSETGPNTNDPVRMIVRNDVPTRVWQGDKAGDDLFVLEATAADDVAVVLATGGTPRERVARDKLLQAYASRVQGPGADDLLAHARDAHAARPTPETPIQGLLDGRPMAKVIDDLDSYTPEQQLQEVTGYYRALERNTQAFETARFASLMPLPKPRMVGVAGVGAVSAFADAADGVQRGAPVLTAVDGAVYRHIALEAWRLYVLSYAREAHADASLRDAFAARFAGMSVDDAGLKLDGASYVLDQRLMDAPVNIDGGHASYLGREIPVDDTGNFSLRYRTPLPAELDPLYARSDEHEKQRLRDYYTSVQVTALYPTVSAADVLHDWDVVHFRERGYAQTRDKLKARIRTLEEDVEDFDGADKVRAEAALKAAQEQLATLPEAGPAEGFKKTRLGEPSALVKDKVVFIAGTASGLSDLHATPLSPRTPGTYVIANAFDNLKSGDFMVEGPGWLAWFTGLAAVLAAVFAVLYAGRMRNGLLLVIALGALTLVAGWAAFSAQLWMNMSLPMAGLILGFSHGALAKALTEGRQKRQREQFARQYMGRELVDHVIKNPGSLKLGGENRELTIFFSDVAGFTTVTETLGPNNPERLVELLNVYLERMTDLMLSTGGVIDKYIGDAIMCFWGAPVSQEDHAARACRGALLCRSELQRMQPLFADAVRGVAPQLIKPDGTVLYARAGINTGVVTVGNMGSSKRFAYTVMGDAVNLAARLEPQCKEYGTDILIGQKTEAQVRGQFTLRRIDLMVVKGKTEPVQVFELMGDLEVPQFIKDLLRHFEEGVDLFRDRQFEAALKAFANAAHHEAIQTEGEINPSRLYMDRCREFMSHPPAADWNGVFVKKTK